ncbi:MAG: hypothetical protein R6U61_01380 [Thermoplasmata archaeon]
MNGECCEPGHGRKGNGHHGRGHHKMGHGKRCGCGCHHGWRKFRTKEEIIDELEDYKEELHKELQAVEEKIEHMESH